jgi:hypothetical protein
MHTRACVRRGERQDVTEGRDACSTCVRRESVQSERMGDRMHAPPCVSAAGWTGCMLGHAYRRRAAGGFTINGQTRCMLEHAYRGRAARRFINDGGRDAYWRTHAEVTGMGRDRWRDAYLRVHAKVEWEGRDACLRAHAKVIGGMGWWDRMHT